MTDEQYAVIMQIIKEQIGDYLSQALTDELVCSIEGAIDDYLTTGSNQEDE